MGKKASPNQIAEIVSMLAKGTISHEQAQAIIENRISVSVLERITVPNLPAAELIAQAQSKLELTYLDGDLAKWDFVTDECGKTYEVQSWKPGREVVPATEVREHFKDGFVGNTAAFIALMTRDNPEGYHASIPADDRLFQSGGLLYAPYFLRDECDRKLGLRHDVRDRWRDDMCFWAFREFKNA
ncbi:MAG: hypothetical protein WCK01_04155 [Candidatus Uhrbacteria bacterium]